MTNIILSGSGGRMGKTIVELAAKTANCKVVGGIDKMAAGGEFPTVTSPVELAVTADCIVDFSNPALLDQLLDYCVKNATPLVLATTGYSPEDKEKIEAASEQVAVFFTANMSIGVNLLAELCKQASQILGEGFDIEIIEKHHNQKLDSPSGTALLLADEINLANGNKYHYNYNRHEKREKRDPKEIGIHGVRGGTIVGEHEVLFAGEDEVINLSHIAYSRSVFASGALRAAQFIKNKPPGLYSMKDIIEL